MMTMGLLLLPGASFAGKDPSDYPLRVRIIELNWTLHDVHRSEYRAVGRGDILDGSSLHAFDFSYDCSIALTTTAINRAYSAKWSKPQLRLVLLGLRLGSNDKFDECELKTTVHDGIYISVGNSVIEMSQQDYKAWNAKRMNKARQQIDATPTAPVSRLSLSSTPDRAEIDIDGQFMGETPSILEVSPGEHSISIRKDGYKLWERKTKLVVGQITLNAELEPETPKQPEASASQRH